MLPLKCGVYRFHQLYFSCAKLRANAMIDTPQTEESKQLPAEGDIGLSSGQLMMALQLGIFLPFLGPLVILAIWGMNRHKPSSALLLKIGLAFIFMQLLTASLIYGYYISHKLPAETLTY